MSSTTSVNSQSKLRRAGWMIVDQAANSLFSLLAGLMAAQLLGVVGFGVFSTLFAAYLFVRDSLRALVLDPMIIRNTPDQRDQPSIVLTLSLVVAGFACAAALVLTLFWSQLTAATALAFGLASLLLLVVEALRSFEVLEARPARAAGLSLLLIVGALAAFPMTGLTTPVVSTVFGIVSAGGLVAALSCLRRLAAMRLHRPSAWLLAHRAIGMPLFADFLASAGVMSLALFVLAGIDIEQAAGLRGAQMIAAPLTLFYVALVQSLTAEGSRLRQSSPESIESYGWAVLGAMVCAGLAATLLVYVLRFQLVRALGDSADVALPVLVPMTIFTLTTSASLAASGVLRSRNQSVRAMEARFLSSVPFAVGIVVGAVVGGARGLAVGGSLANLVTVGVWWRAVTQTRPQVAS